MFTRVYKNRNYLGHNFIQFSSNNSILKCNSCGVVIVYILDEDLSEYNLRVLDFKYQKTYSKFIGDILTLTCNEIIIKQIIE